jgi:hypothetical protein
MAKIIQLQAEDARNSPEGAAGQARQEQQERQALEGRFKQAVAGLGRLFELPPTPQPPENQFEREGPGEMQPEDRRAIWELQQDVKALKDRYNLCVKVVWRTSAALLGLAAPLIGSDLLAKFIGLLGQ